MSNRYVVRGYAGAILDQVCDLGSVSNSRQNKDHIKISVASIDDFVKEVRELRSVESIFPAALCIVQLHPSLLSEYDTSGVFGETLVLDEPTEETPFIRVLIDSTDESHLKNIEARIENELYVDRVHFSSKNTPSGGGIKTNTPAIEVYFQQIPTASSGSHRLDAIKS